jgi:hypothetical protein
MSEGISDNSGPAAAEGTCAHTVAEHYGRLRFDSNYRNPRLTYQLAPIQIPPEGLDLKGKTPEEWNLQLQEHGRAYVDFIQSLIPAGEEAHVSFERKVDIHSIHGQLFGTSDCIIWLPRLRKLIVVDYKYGFGDVDVGTYDDTNPQLAAYLIGGQEALRKAGLELETAAVAVYQPRRPLRDPGQVLELDLAWTVKERMKLAAEVAAVDNPPPPRPGDHCRYCKGKSKCPATHNALQTAVSVHCGTIDLLSVPDVELIQIFASRAAFKAFWEDVEERIDKLVRGGHANLRVKESQGRQMYKDPKLVAQTFLAMGRADLLQPVALSESLQHIPEAMREELVKRSAPSRTVQVVDVDSSPSALASLFKKYSKST